MNVLITGVAGFVGSHIAERMIAEGNTVVGIDSMTDYYSPLIKRRNLERLAGPSFRLVEGDLNKLSLRPLLDDIGIVYHQAGQPGVRKSWGQSFESYIGDNISATQRLLEAMTDCSHVQRFVYASSSSIYGDAEHYPTSEHALPAPRSPYGVTKLAAEHLCTLYAQEFAVPTVSLRYFTVFGPRQRPDMAFHKFCHAALTDGLITIYGDGNQERSFTYIDDVVEANLKAGTAQVPPGSRINVAGGNEVSINAVLDTLERITGIRLNINYLPAAAGDVRRTGGDTTLASEVLDWRASTGLVDGLEKQLAWIEQMLTEGLLARNRTDF